MEEKRTKPLAKREKKKSGDKMTLTPHKTRSPRAKRQLLSISRREEGKKHLARAPSRPFAMPPKSSSKQMRSYTSYTFKEHTYKGQFEGRGKRK